MDIPGFPSPSVRTTENHPRQRDSADALPSLSQLRLLYEEAVQEETAPSPVQEPAVGQDEPAPQYTASALRADIPTLSQLNALREEDLQQVKTEPPLTYDEPSRPRVAEQPVRRSAPITPKQKKTSARRIRAVAVPTGEDPVQRERPSFPEENRKVSAADIPSLSQLNELREEAQNTVQEPAWEPPKEAQWAPGTAPQWAPGMAPQWVPGMYPQWVPGMYPQWDPRMVPQWDPGMAPQWAPGMAPQWDPRMAAQWEAWRGMQQEPRREPQPEPQKEYRQEPAEEKQPAPARIREEQEEPRPSRVFTAEDIPSLTSLRQARETADRMDADRDEDDAFEMALREETAAITRDIEPEDPADSLPTVAQLRAQLEEEKLYGNLAFQDSVRQIKQVLKDPSPAAAPVRQAASAPITAAPQAAVQPPLTQAPQQAAPEKKADSAQKVHFIPYEDFLKEEDFDNFTASGKNGETGSPRSGGRNRGDTAEAKAFRQKMAGSQRKRRDEAAEDSAQQDAQLKKKRDPKILYWISSLRRTS